MEDSLSEHLDWVERRIGKDNYLVLRNYLDFNLYARGILLRLDFDTISAIDDGTFHPKLSAEESRKAKSLLQLDIISKMMMYMEDFITVFEALMSDPRKLAVKMVDRQSPRRLERFFKNLDKLSDDDIRKVLGYPKVDELEMSDEDKAVISGLLGESIAEVRRVLAEFARFYKQHRIAFTKFKHVLPIIVGAERISDTTALLGEFDWTSLVMYDTKDPVGNLFVLPFSEKTLEGYRIVVRTLQTFFKDILESWNTMIEHELDWILPPELYVKGHTQETKRYGEIVDSLLPKQGHGRTIEIRKSSSQKKEQYDWYFHLDKLIEMAKSRSVQTENQD